MAREAAAVATISIITTFYNSEKYLRECIESVISQSYQDWELILWNDGSSDTSLTIANEFANTDERIIVVSNQENKGRGYALKQAIVQSKGEFFGILDSDDILLPEALKVTFELLTNNSETGWLYTNYYDGDEQGNVLGLGRRCQIAYSPNNELETSCTFHFRLIRRSFYARSLGVDENLRVAVDYDLCLKLSEVGKPIHLRRALYKYRHHERQISQLFKLQQSEAFVDSSQAAIERRGLSDSHFLSYDLDCGSFKLCIKRHSHLPISNKVFGIGLGRTGTKSLNRALIKLGYNSIHNPRNLEILKEFDAALDILIAINYQALDKLYIGSKFILTTRPIESWLDSWIRHDRRLRSSFNGKLSPWETKVRAQLYGQSEFNRNVWAEKYRQHYTNVLTYFSGDRAKDLLIFDVFAGDEWRKLNNFLNTSSLSLIDNEKLIEVLKSKFPILKN